MLLARPIPFQDEAPASILMRAASMNGWSSVTKMLAANGTPSGKVALSWRAPARYLRYTDTLGIRVPEHSGAFRPNPDCRFGSIAFTDSISVPDAIFRGEGQAICPDCILSKPYLKRLWSIRLISSCPIHGHLLIDTCPCCGQHLHWNRPAPELCICGYDLRLSQRLKANRKIANQVTNIIMNDNQKQLDEIVEVFSGLSEAYAGHFTVKIDQQLAEIAVEASIDISIGTELLAEWVKNRASIEHPRLSLTPLLRKKGLARNLAISTLKTLNDLIIPPVVMTPLTGNIVFSDCSLALGDLSFGAVCELEDLSLLQRASTRKNDDRVLYTRSSADALLRRLWKPASSDSTKRLLHEQPKSVAVLIANFMENPIANAGYDMAEGLISLREKSIQDVQDKTRHRAETVGLTQAAELLKVQPGVVRNLIKTGYLTTHQVRKASCQIMLNKSDVHRFNEKYICAGALLRGSGMKLTTLIKKLQEKEIYPVGSPGMHGLHIYIFRRQVLADLNILSDARCV